MNNKKGIGCGCFTVIAICLLLLVLMFSCTGGGDSSTDDQAEQEEQTEQTDNSKTVNVGDATIDVNQTLEFGGYTITVTKVKLSVNTLIAYLEIYNNNAIPMTINEIMGFYAFQGDATLNGADFKSLNSGLLDTTIQPYQTLTDIDLTLALASDTDPIELSFFPDDATGFNEDGATEMDITINPVDKTVNTEFNTY